MASLSVSDRTYDEIHSLIKSISILQDQDKRRIIWLADRKIIGIARRPNGALEIFLAGPQLLCSDAKIEMHLEHEEWEDDSHRPFQATRLSLPQGNHFDAIAAFLCVHLLENGVLEDVQQGFSRSEAAIAVTLDQARLHEESILGLIGELLLLRACLRQSSIDVARILESWEGYQRSTRDFIFNKIGVEVKTTLYDHSRHRMGGLHQVEPTVLPSGEYEKQFLLVSIGLERVGEGEDENFFLLPTIVDSILALVREAAPSEFDYKLLSDDFLAKVRMYGLAGSSGYDHSTMKGKAAFTKRFRLVFTRGYDMADPNIGIFHTGDIAPYRAVLVDSITFTVSLPNTVTGDTNPLPDMPAVAHHLTR